jgi:hypothetical protein
MNTKPQITRTAVARGAALTLSITLAAVASGGCGQKWTPPTASAKDDAKHAAPETRVFEFEEGNTVYVFADVSTANAFLTDGKFPARTVTKPAYSEQKKDVVFDDTSYTQRNALIAAYAKAHRLEVK